MASKGSTTSHSPGGMRAEKRGMPLRNPFDLIPHGERLLMEGD